MCKCLNKTNFTPQNVQTFFSDNLFIIFSQTGQYTKYLQLLFGLNFLINVCVNVKIGIALRPKKIEYSYVEKWAYYFAIEGI